MVVFQDTGADRNDRRNVPAQVGLPDSPIASSRGADNQDLSQLKIPGASLPGIESPSAPVEHQPTPWGGPRLVENIAQSWADREYGRAVFGTISGGIPIVGSYIGRAVSELGAICTALGIGAFQSTPLSLLGNPEHTVTANLILWSIGGTLAIVGGIAYLTGKSVQLPCDFCAAAVDAVLASPD
jgi:hypothetical protein